MNKNIWKIALPLLSTTIAAVFALWLQPRSQPPDLEQALASFAAPEGSRRPADYCTRYQPHGCRLRRY